MHGLLIAMASLVAEHGSREQVSEVVVHRLSRPMHVGSSWIRSGTHVSCIGRQILNPWTTRDVLSHTSWFPSTYQALGFSGGSDDKESA